MRKLFVVIGIAALGVYACTEGSGPTKPSPIVRAPVSVQTVNSTPAPFVPTPEPGGGPGPTSYEGKDCEGVLITTAPNAPRRVNVRYTAPLDDSTVYLSVDLVVPANGSINVPSAQEVFEANFEIPDPSCEPWSWAERVQCDFTAGQGEHLGGQFADVSLSVAATEPGPDGEPTVITTPLSEWGECMPVQRGNNGPEAECSKSRSVAITTTQEFTCGGESIITVEETTETEPCECPCVENGPYEGEIIWDPTILGGKCPAETTPDLEGICHQDGTRTTTWDCQEPTERSVCTRAECDNHVD